MKKILAPNLQKVVDRPINVTYNSDIKIKNLIWSKGPLATTYSNFSTERNSSSKQIRNIIEENDGLIFIRLGSTKKIKDLEHFADNLHFLTKPVILVTSDGDRSVPSSYNESIYNKILSDNMIRKWYTQNYDHSVEHEKLRHLPIGFDLHTSKWLIDRSIEKKLSYIISQRYNNPIDKRQGLKIFCDSHKSQSHKERAVMYSKLKDNKSIDFISQSQGFTEIIKLYVSYKFVLCPRGNGLDTHRLWELLLCGVIPIVKKSPLDNMYLENDLPVVIIDDWDDINNDTQKKLKLWYEERTSFLNDGHIFQRLSFDYWLK